MRYTWRLHRIRFCNAHKPPHFVNFKNRYCLFDRCRSQASYGQSSPSTLIAQTGNFLFLEQIFLYQECPFLSEARTSAGRGQEGKHRRSLCTAGCIAGSTTSRLSGTNLPRTAHARYKSARVAYVWYNSAPKSHPMCNS